MAVTVLMFDPPPSDGESELVRALAAVRSKLARRQARHFQRAGASEILVVAERQNDLTFGEVVAALTPARGGLIVLGAGAVPMLDKADAKRLIKAASSSKAVALTNNRYSSDIVAVSRAAVLKDLPALPSDNALPRWLEEKAGYEVADLPGRNRLALDLDTPLDVALAALAQRVPRWLARAARDNGWRVPRLAELRELVANPHRELLVFGRSGSSTLRWLERNLRCRVRFLAEERGLRASSPLAIAGGDARPPREPRATLGLLLDQRGPGALADIVAELADGAIIDSRVLLAHRHGVDESGWPSAADRFASDLHRADQVEDAWLKELTASAETAGAPILLGGHSLVGPGTRLLLS